MSGCEIVAVAVALLAVCVAIVPPLVPYACTRCKGTTFNESMVCDKHVRNKTGR